MQFQYPRFIIQYYQSGINEEPYDDADLEPVAGTSGEMAFVASLCQNFPIRIIKVGGLRLTASTPLELATSNIRTVI